MTEVVGRAASSRKGLARNAIAGSLGNALKIGIQLVMLPLMAHLLGPGEFGLYALALPTVNFFMVLADGGLGTSLAREDEGATPVWSTAFWLLLVMGAVLAVVVTGWGVVLAMASREPRLAPLMAFLSLSFVLITLSVLPTARLTRRGNLVVFAVSDVGAAVVGAVLAVSLAAAGAGAWSLAAQTVGGYFVRAVFLNVLAFVRPTRTFQWAALRPHLGAGSSLLGARLSDFAARMGENVIFSRTFGAAALGTYTFANQVPRFLCEALANPVWGALYAHALHEPPQQIAGLQLRLMRLMASLLFPGAMLLSAAAPTAIGTVLGPQWMPAATLLQILLPFYALNVVCGIGGALLVAYGRAGSFFWINAGTSVGRVLAVAAGLWIGPVAVVCGISAVNVIAAAAMATATGRLTGTPVRRVALALMPPTLAGVGAALACALVLAQRAASLPWLAVAGVVGLVVYAAATLALDGAQLRADLGLMRQMLRRRGIEGQAG